MSDDLGLFDEETGDSRSRKSRGKSKVDQEDPAARRRKRLVTLIGGAVLLAVVAAGAIYGVREIMSIGGYDDFEGEGEGSVVIEVADGASLGQIAQTMTDEGVIASPRAFTTAAEGNPASTGIQPGFYLLRNEMSGAAALSQILDEDARLGQAEVQGGMLLHDTLAADESVQSQGIITILAEASCAELDGAEQCVSADELWDVAENTDVAELNIPDWAVAGVTAAPQQHRRLEGLIAPGLYHINPSWSAEELLNSVLSTSSTRLQAAGMPGISDDSGFTPYEFLTVASLIEKEGIQSDFPSIATVLYNRLRVDERLRLDSTINYFDGTGSIRTDSGVRNTPNPYNTYLNTGLTPTPVSSPHTPALEAAANPVDETWMYFVKCEEDGTSCFNDTNEEHEADALDAVERGVW
ncbi:MULTISPECIES: endolytic transglycosylase MltG [Actinoalloteichus]|uniref:Endolytic murein transglycosylase n=1 Tax=Actinoalloteichus fjordicus TaxID=1612552 RepID=A0AAC9LBU2_9PSEU|nr:MULTISPECIES: endolytic transglycosylase MltG [Actinoalloteichus]APU14471.1 YceG family protein [Actinoalloteichus fjordicus]APU20440.1 YceG family protein [Actinoalloteichus sp. GBA129-24]